MMKKRTARVLLLLAVALPLWATAQAPDVLVIDGKKYDLNTNPLEPYLRANPRKLPQPEITSTGLWRGYIATFSLRDKRLFVDDVKMLTKAAMEPNAPEGKRFKSVMVALFGDGAPHAATWFTGNLIVPTGELVNYVHMGYASTYSSYIVVTVVGGEVRRRQDLDEKQFDAFRRAQFAAFKKTTEYAEMVARLKKDDKTSSDDMLEGFIFEFASGDFLSRVFTH